jgi:hypothetical protein
MWVHGQHVEAGQLHKGLEQIGRVLVAGGAQMREITSLPVNGSAPYQPRTGTVNGNQSSSEDVPGSFHVIPVSPCA